jgi:hypothetical protein
MLIVSPAIIMAGLLKDLKIVARLTPLGVAACASSCCLICAKALYDAHVWQEWPESDRGVVHRMLPESIVAIGICIAVISSAFGVIPVLPSLICGMRDPREFPSVWRLSMGFVTSFYVLVIAIGHYGYGIYCSDNVTESMTFAPQSLSQALSTVPRKHWTGYRSEIVGDIMAILVITDLLVKYPLMFVVLAELIQNAFSSNHSWCVAGTCANNLIRAVMGLGVVGIASCVPNLLQCLGLFFSVIGPMGLVLPLWFSHLIDRSRGEVGCGVWRRSLHVSIALFSLVTLVLGLESLVASFFRSD